MNGKDKLIASRVLRSEKMHIIDVFTKGQGAQAELHVEFAFRGSRDEVSKGSFRVRGTFEQLEVAGLLEELAAHIRKELS
jgi:hypothetical protein